MKLKKSRTFFFMAIEFLGLKNNAKNEMTKPDKVWNINGMNCDYKRYLCSGAQQYSTKESQYCW